MASYHCTVKVGGKGKAGAHAAYIAREGKYSGKARYEDLEATAHGNMPGWAVHNPAHFWAAADEHERANGATYREIEIALPRELTPEQRRALVEDFIAQEVGDKHAYQWAIHTPSAALEGGEQPHAHIMYSERTLDAIARDPEQYFKRYNAKNPEKGGCRKDSRGTDEHLQATRERWADVQNAHLERHGHAARVDHRSLKEQGIDRESEKHIGASRIADMPAPDVAALLTRRAAETELEQAQRDVSQIDVAVDLTAAIADRDHQLNLKQKQEQENEQRVISLGRITENLRAADRASQTTIEDAHRFNRASRAVAKAARGQHARRAGDIASAVGAELERVVPQITGAVHQVERAQAEAAKAAQERIAAAVITKAQAVAAAAAKAAQERIAAAVAKAQADAIAAAKVAQADQERIAAAAAAKAQTDAIAAAKAAQERAVAVAAAKAQAAAERKAAWAERGARRRSGTPSRVIRLDQSVQAGRTVYRWTGSGPSAGKIAVVQNGNQLAASGKYSQPKAKAMAQIAQSNGWQTVKITGDDAFKAMALPEFLALGIAVSNPELQPQIAAIAQAKQQATAQADAIDAAQAVADAKDQADALRLKQALEAIEASKRAPKPRSFAAEREAKREAEQQAEQAERASQQTQPTAEQRAAANGAARDAAALAVQSNQSAPGARAVDVPAVATPAPARRRLTGEDVAMFQGAERALAAGDMKALARQLYEIDKLEDRLTDAATPSPRDTQPFDHRDELRMLSNRDVERRWEAVNAEARALGHAQVPFAVGQGVLHSATFDYGQKAAATALARHSATKRPQGFFGENKETRAWDAQGAELQRHKGEFDKALAWRDGRESALRDADGATFSARLDEQRKQHAAKSNAAIAQCAPARERLQDFAQERQRIERAADQVLTPEKQRELQRGRDDYGIGL